MRWRGVVASLRGACACATAAVITPSTTAAGVLMGSSSSGERVGASVHWRASDGKLIRLSTGISMLLAGLLATVLAAPIDRQSLVARHFPVVTSVDPDAPLTVGNGRFAFTADVTG